AGFAAPAEMTVHITPAELSMMTVQPTAIQGVGGDTSEPTPTAAPSLGAGGEVAATVSMVDIGFGPTEVTIPANTDATIAVTNKGATVHNFNIDLLNVHSGDIQAWQTGSVTISAPAGTYQFYCTIPGHKEAGMVGTLHVQ